MIAIETEIQEANSLLAKHGYKERYGMDINGSVIRVDKESGPFGEQDHHWFRFFLIPYLRGLKDQPEMLFWRN